MSSNSEQFYEFGRFQLDTRERQLLREGAAVPLTPKAFEMLLVLVENGGHVMEKDELLKKVWPDTIVEEANLSHIIYKLREALGENHDGEKFIETVPRRGYRFVAKVTVPDNRNADLIIEEHSRSHIVVDEDDAPQNSIETSAVPLTQSRVLPSPSRARRFSISRPGAMIAGAIVLVAVAAGLYIWRTRESRTPATGAALHSIAVLPFKPLAANDRDESLEIGMAETLITRLSRIGQLTVRPTSAVRRYTKLEDEAVRAGRELKVDAVLDGSIQKSGDRVRVSVRLVGMELGQTLWAEQFDEKFTDIFSVQDAISRRVSDMLAVRLSGEEKERLAKRGTDNSEAYQTYLLGRFHWNKLTEEDTRKSIEYFNQAIARDRNYGLAYAGLADSYIALPNFSNTPSSEAIIKARDAAMEALAIDDTIAEAHTSLAVVKELYEWDFPGAEKEFKRSIELNPNYPTAHSWYSQFLSSVGRHAEAIAEAKRAQEVDPLSLYANVALANTYIDARQPDEAIAPLQRTIEMDKNFALAHLTLAEAYRAKERYEDYFAEVTKSMVLSGRNSPEQAVRKANMLKDGYQKSGAKGYWEKNLELRIENMKRGYTSSPAVMAEAYARTGDKDRAFEWLEKAYTERDQYLFYNLKTAYHFDGIRSDPRYAKLLQRIGLPQ
jgi:DNA-binding winged helix-turn-helix (wHTH) protein/TolB-like protein